MVLLLKGGKVVIYEMMYIVDVFCEDGKIICIV